MDKPSKKNIELHAKLNRPLSSILTQMRTGNISLRHFLYKRKVLGIDDRECQCRYRAQTVTHILLSCPRFKEERNAWKNEGTWSSDARKILSDGKYVARAAKFMLETKLLGQFRSIDLDL
jgi:hypothetical protein